MLYERTRSGWTHWSSSLYAQIEFTWIFWVGSPTVGPPTSLQYKSYLGVPVSSCPQVAVADILEPSARLKYGGFKLKPVRSLKVSCPCASLNSVIPEVKNTARRWTPVTLLAMLPIRDPSRCWEQPAPLVIWTCPWKRAKTEVELPVLRAGALSRNEGRKASDCSPTEFSGVWALRGGGRKRREGGKGLPSRFIICVYCLTTNPCALRSFYLS